MQRVCKQKLEWDEVLPNELYADWNFILTSLDEMGVLSVPRRLESNDHIAAREFHGFCDASVQGYGTCIYVKSTYISGEIETNLITSKTRVAPIKEQTIPRLELLSALLLARLMNSTESALSSCFVPTRKFYWTDSQIALAWIKSVTKEFKPFVENRL
jgi:Pao retrotransposon peptidase.